MRTHKPTKMSMQNKNITANCCLKGITNPAYEPEPGYAWDGCMSSANRHPGCNNNIVLPNNNNNNGISSGIGAILNDCTTKW